MLDLKLIRENLNYVKECVKKRGLPTEIVDEIYKTDEERRSLICERDRERTERNLIQKEINRAEGNEKRSLIEKARSISDRIALIESRLKSIDHKLLGYEDGTPKGLLLEIPNIPHSNVPVGRENKEIRRVGKRPEFSFSPKPHWEIGERLGIFDQPRAAKVAGARFSLLVGAGARLERALINFMLDIHTKEHGYSEILLPFLVNSDTMTGTGQLPKFASDLFRVAETDYWLIPTAEVPLTNIYKDEILSEEDLPLLYTAYTPCFRREAGAYGTETKGLIRQHQFNKVELVRFTKPEDSYTHLERLVLDAEEVLKRLDLHYRVVALCTEDLGFSASFTYDIEVWMPARDSFVEISSCSNFESFQARRCNIKFKKEGEKPQFVHTLNGSGLAVGRCVAAILENFQREDGTVEIPEALHSYMDEKVIG
jgi:seryl-tRNA synthetase